MKNNVYIFAEVQTEEDRERVADAIRALRREGKIDLILADDIGMHSAQNPVAATKHKKDENYRISPRTYDLCLELNIPAIGIDNWEKKLYLRDIINDKGEAINQISSTTIRENKMADMINKYALLGNCAVIVEESRVRGLPSKRLGGTSVIVKKFLCDPNVKFFSSPATALEEEAIVKIEGPIFNHHIFTRLITLGNIFIEEQQQYYTPDFFERRSTPVQQYKLDDFLYSRIATYGKVIDNTIVSMVVVKPITETLIQLHTVFTHPNYRYNGYISDIFKRIFLDYPKKHYTFELNVLNNNVDARRLYDRLGFQPVYLNLGL